MNIYAKISKKGQVTIPKAIREKLNLGENGAVLFSVERDEVKIKGVPGSTAEKLAGSLKKYAKKYEPLEEIRPKIQEKIGRVADEDQG